MDWDHGARITRNTLLKGMPGRGWHESKKHHETGQRRSEKNPDGPNFYPCPHLAHINPAEFDATNAILDQRNQHFRRKPIDGKDPRHQVPRKRTRFPGQSARCWYCGQPYVWGGNGITGSLMCNGPREWHCWNSIGVDGTIACERIIGAITSEIYQLDGFDQQFLELLQSEGTDAHPEEWERLRQDEARVAREMGNLTAAIAEYGPSSAFRDKLLELQAAERDNGAKRWQIEQRRQPLQLPGSIAELRALFEQELRNLSLDSFDLGNLLRRLVPEFHVYLVRRFDGGHLLPRAKVKLDLAGIVPDLTHLPGATELMTRTVTLDLFEPTQTERIREEAMLLQAQGLGQREISRKIAEHPTQTAVYNALKLGRKMQELGLQSPYVTIFEPPADYLKLRRPKHPRYAFTPLDGYQRPEI